jgi:hypothetical protein
MAEEVRVLLIEGVATDDGVKIRYKLPPIANESMIDFYKAFIIQLCENIAQLEGAEGLFEVVEDEDDGT